VPVHHYGKLDEQRESVKNDAYYHLCKRKVADKPNDPQALRELAGQAQVLGKLDEALATWTRLAEVAPQTAVAYLNIGTLSAELGRFDEARVAARRARALDPKLREAAYSEALCELYVGDATKAVELLEGVCREDTRYAPAQSLLAVAACCAGQTDRGVEMMAGFRKLNPGYDASLAHLVGRLIEAGSTPRAATLLEAAQKAGFASPELEDLWHRCAA